VLAARKVEGLEAVASECSAAGASNVLVQPTDIAERGQIEDLFAWLAILGPTSRSAVLVRRRATKTECGSGCAAGAADPTAPRSIKMTIESNVSNAEQLVAESPQPGCKSLPRVDVLSEMRVHPAAHTHDLARKWWVWSGATHVGDCTMQDEMLTIKADGTANFFAHVISSDDDDQWVFYGGISLLDAHGAVLWTSPKLVGPQMNWENEWTTWDQDFAFPALWFDSAAGARINQAHC
jgi:Family of unknown function (DUF6294)